MGTTDYLADTLMRHRAEAGPRTIPQDRDIVHGELLTFEDPEKRLPALDGLEGFRPRAESFYRRVLIPAALAETGETVLTWTYAAEAASGVYLPGGRWPP